MTQWSMPSRFPSEVEPPEDLAARIRDAVRATPAAKTSTRLRTMVALVVVPVLGLAVQVLVAHLDGRPALRGDVASHVTARLVLLAFGLALWATLVAVSRGERGLGRGARSLFLVAVLVTPLYAALALLSAGARDAAVAAPATMSPWGLRCVALAAAQGLLVLVAGSGALRRSAPVARRVRGAALGAAAGAWAGLSVVVFCPAAELRHVLVGHVLPVAAFTLLGCAAVPRVLRP